MYDNTFTRTKEIRWDIILPGFTIKTRRGMLESGGRTVPHCLNTAPPTLGSTAQCGERICQLRREREKCAPDFASELSTNLRLKNITWNRNLQPLIPVQYPQTVYLDLSLARRESPAPAGRNWALKHFTTGWLKWPQVLNKLQWKASCSDHGS